MTTDNNEPKVTLNLLWPDLTKIQDIDMFLSMDINEKSKKFQPICLVLINFIYFSEIFKTPSTLKSH